MVIGVAEVLGMLEVAGMLVRSEEQMAMKQVVTSDQMSMDEGDARHIGRGQTNHTEQCACQQEG
jgi:hypothetical protein